MYGIVNHGRHVSGYLCFFFSDVNISQGIIATRSRYGGVFHYGFAGNLLLSLSVKESWISISIWKSWRQKYNSTFFQTRYTINDSELKIKSTKAQDNLSGWRPVHESSPDTKNFPRRPVYKSANLKRRLLTVTTQTIISYQHDHHYLNFETRHKASTSTHWHFAFGDMLSWQQISCTGCKSAQYCTTRGYPLPFLQVTFWSVQ